MQTFLVRGTLNSRAKDLYDLYVLAKLVEKNDNALKTAFKETCRCRKFEIDEDKAMKTFESVSLSSMQRKAWESFSRKTSYAKEISFDEVLVTIGRLIKIIF